MNFSEITKEINYLESSIQTYNNFLILLKDDIKQYKEDKEYLVEETIKKIKSTKAKRLRLVKKILLDFYETESSLRIHHKYGKNTFDQMYDEIKEFYI